MSLLVKHADHVVTIDSRRKIYRDGAVYVEEDRIVAVGPTAEVLKQYPRADEVIDGRGKAVFPGFVNTHTHLFQVLLKGLGDDLVLKDWIKTVIVPSSRKLTYKCVHASALLGSLEAIRSGTTTTLDFMYPHPAPKLSEAVLRAFTETGIRGIVGHGVIDTGRESGLPEEIIHNAEDSFREVRHLVHSHALKSDGMLGVWLAPVAVWGVTEVALEGCRRTAEELGIGVTIHTAETPFEVENCRSRFKCSEMELFERADLLGPTTLLVHCVYFDAEDIKIAKKHNARISHNAISNMYLSSGVAPVPQMLNAGLTVGIGVDGAASNNNQDMVQLIKNTALLQKVAHPGDPTIITAKKVLEMATIDGARALNLDRDVGSLEVGKRADLVVLNLKKPFVAPAHNPVSALVYSATSENIEDTIVNGRPIMRDREILGLDEEEVIKNAIDAADELVESAGITRLKNRIWTVRPGPK
jgi:5-methylthioadenosine/S-adenosylhomocysteine deaminase